MGPIGAVAGVGVSGALALHQVTLHVHVPVAVHVSVDNLLCVIFALLTSASNAAASVLQRKAAAQVPPENAMHVSLIKNLLGRPVWLAGIGFVLVAAVCQAAALASGPIALVQPIFIIELPVTLLLAALANGRSPRLLPWTSIAATTVGLGAGLACAAPSGATETASNTVWIITLIITAGFELALITTALPLRGEGRAALLGLAAACGYALTAALMKNAMADLGTGGGIGLFTNWHIYATAIAGVGALFLLQNALQAGTLVASQPMLTVGDALISISYGVTLYNETLRTGWWLIPQVAALLMIIYGCIQTAKSPIAAEAAPSGTADRLPGTVTS
ncbi:MAG TPA: DMT family transporter [Trebonia sp.]|nr:DMT family transporter [Trebonia sp.]